MTRCRSCHESRLTQVLDLGLSPIADHLLLREQLQDPALRFPLTVVLCEACGLLQLTESVDPNLLFGNDYPYLSSVSETVLENAIDNVGEILQEIDLKPGDLVVEVASNDGYLLQRFVALGHSVLGIDPALPAVERARSRGIPTVHNFFGIEMARKLRRDKGPAHLIFANNVLAHVRDLNGFVAGLRELLHPDGLLRIEAPYVVDLVDKGAFDTIYHQHLYYFSLATMTQLFHRHQLVIHRADRIPIHGGSLRLTLGHQGQSDSSIHKLLTEEQSRGVNTLEFYQSFAHSVKHITQNLKRHLINLKDQGFRIAAYGAAAKGTTLLHSAQIDHRLLDYVVDRNSFKHGRFLDGPGLEIKPVEHLLVDRPDYVLLLAWNHSAEILKQQRVFRERGGHFIIPLPDLREC